MSEESYQIFGYSFGGFGAGQSYDTKEEAIEQCKKESKGRTGFVAKVGPTTFEVIWKSWDKWYQLIKGSGVEYNIDGLTRLSTEPCFDEHDYYVRELAKELLAKIERGLA
jgi:hypothetical protein